MTPTTQLPAGLQLLFGLLAACAFGAGLSPRAVAVTMTVDAANVLSDVSENPLGINVDYLMDDDSARPRDRSTAEALREMNVRYVRYPGGEKGDNHLWSVAPFTTPNIKAARPNAWPSNDLRFFSNGVDGRDRLLDFDEFVAMSQAAGTEPVMVVAFDSMYKAASGNETPPTKQKLKDTAVEWVRYANVTKGYGIKYWTLGNETDYPASYAGANPGATTYANDVVEFAQAMKAVDPTIKIGINGQSLTWFRAVLAIAKDHVDFLEVHTYPFYNYSGYAQYQSSAGNYTGEVVNKAMAAINELAAPYRERMFATLTETNAIPFGGSWADVNDLGHAVAVFDIFGQHLEVDKLKFIMLWNTRWVNNDRTAPFGETVGAGPSVLGSGDNPGFESGSTGWNLASGATIVSDAYAGTQALKAVNASVDVYVTKNLNPALFQPGITYALSFWAKKTAGTGWVGAGIDFYKNGVKVIGDSAEVTTSSYARLGATCMAPEDFDAVQVWTFTTAGTTAFFDEFAASEPRETPAAVDAIDRKGNTYAIGKALGIWGTFLKENMVAVSGETTGVRAYATKNSAGSLSVAILNKASTASTVTVNLQNHGGLTTGERWQLAGTGPNDLAPVWSNIGSVPVTANSVTLTVPAVSITVLDLNRNLLTDPAFESGGAAWTNWGNSTVVSSNVRSGAKALRVGTASGGRGQAVTALLAPNTTYRLSGFGKLDNTSEAAWFGVDIDQGGTRLFTEADQFTTTSYQNGEVRFTTPGVFDHALIWIWKDPGAGYLWLDDLVLHQVPATDVTAGLVGHWKLDDSGATAIDSRPTGTANPGTLKGNATWNASGRVARALALDGTNDWVQIPDSTDYHGAQLSFSAWVNASAADSQARALISKRSGPTTARAFGAFTHTGGKLFIDIGASRTDTGIVLGTGWKHVAVVFDGGLPANRLKVYIDGASMPAWQGNPGTVTTIPDTTAAVHIGILNANFGYGWNGLIDDVRIYNRALSATEVGIVKNQ